MPLKTVAKHRIQTTPDFHILCAEAIDPTPLNKTYDTRTKTLFQQKKRASHEGQC